MAVDVCSEISSLGASPRISFSYDLNQTESNGAPVNDHRRSDFSLLDSNSDFHFCIGKSFAQELPSADELFSNGKILPTQIRKLIKTNQTQQPNSNLAPFQPITSSNVNASEDKSKKKRLKEYLSSSFDAEEEQEQEKPLSKSFWQFRRSSSLNCDNTQSRSLIKSLQFLSRSNSTGSVPTVQKQRVSQKQNQKHQIETQKQQSSSTGGMKLNSTAFNSYNSSKKTPLGKNCRSYGSGVRISPVLHIPPTYISLGTMNLFGFGALFCNGKAKKKKK